MDIVDYKIINTMCQYNFIGIEIMLLLSYRVTNCFLGKDFGSILMIGKIICMD
ncbi:hypothetical protein [uncultured Clostridium sp.]|uniref:hypothetical protein n=1 Tax=uncultured Clostridium sp. TaxID=59620 RepID=UPI002619D28C|nr:hypothetical protein [uncultured Clostridium sp.]